MALIRLVLLSCLGFALPVVFAVFVSPYFSSQRVNPKKIHTEDGLVSSVDSVQHLPTEPSSGRLPSMLLGESIEDFLLVDSDQNLDPASGRNFLLRFTIQVNKLPQQGRRQAVIAKLTTGTRPPYPGWAIAFRELATSVRPEIYWQGKNGHGGWYTFDTIDFADRRTYTLVLVARESEFLSLYLVEQANTKIKFLGGYNIQSVDVPQSEEALIFAGLLGNKSSASVMISELLIARPKQIFDDKNQIKSLLLGDDVDLTNKLSNEEIMIWVDSQGKEKSRFSRTLRTIARVQS